MKFETSEQTEDMQQYSQPERIFSLPYMLTRSHKQFIKNNLKTQNGRIYYIKYLSLSYGICFIETVSHSNISLLMSFSHPGKIVR